MKNVSAKGDVQNVYTEKRDENAAPRKKPFKKQYEKKKEEEPTVELDSDGFEIIGSKPVKKTTNTHHKKDYENRPKRFDGEKKDRKDRKPREEKKEEETHNEEKPKKVAVEEKPVVVEVKAKNLKDLFA
jgi:hypothetical protein